MLNQQQRLENFKANTDQIEQECIARNEREAIEMLKKGFCDKFIRNKCFVSLKRIQELKARVL